MTTIVRRQLTLFLQKDKSEIVEKVRRKFNPTHFELIRAHVTLCREDEIENLDQVLINLTSLNEKAITIQFEKPTRFENGQGVYLKSEDIEQYSKLRRKILKTIIDEPRKQIPHITLIHPRSSTCNYEIFQQICNEDFPSNFTFNEISLIEQKDGANWEVLKNFKLIKL
jgi:2'-5' RNA ligase